MLGAGPVLIIASAYLAFLFLLAYLSDRREAYSEAGKHRPIINTPLVYTLSLTVYCTSWTFYGAVGSAARNGLEFFTIYLGPTLVFIGWFFLLRKLVRISKTHRITSIADFISARYGKSTKLAVLVTLMAVIGTTPYIALQLKAVATSFNVVSGAGSLSAAETEGFLADTGFWVACAMAAFIVLFGTRNIGADEHHPGVVAAIAFESLVKLFALIAVGLFVLYGLDAQSSNKLFNSPEAQQKLADLFHVQDDFAPRWITMLFLAGAAIICLPRQFQVTIVEIANERNLQTAAWLFPLYLLLISLFIIPIALAGLLILPEGADPDLFVLTVPLAAGADKLALFAFIGGFSSATSMMIVASIALSIMISNHIVMPILLRAPGLKFDRQGDIAQIVLIIRRISIIVILLLGYLYYRLSAKSDDLAAIGLISFAAAAQFLPALIGGIFWRNGTERGAFAALIAGISVWAYTLLVPTFERAGYLSGMIENGPWGLTLLRPEALFGLTGWDPLVHAMFWSYGANIGVYILVSLFTRAKPLESLQRALFIDVFRRGTGQELRVLKRSAAVGDLIALTQRIIGHERTQKAFREFALSQGQKDMVPKPNAELIAFVERQLAGSIGAASARVLVSRVSVGEAISLDEVIEILDETQQVIEYSHRLEQKSQELEQTAAQLRQANDQLKKLDQMKDDFLSRVSHELRTPMTSIRSFSEILLDEKKLPQKQSARALEIIVSESQRLTRLLDEILDVGQFESGDGLWKQEDLQPEDILHQAIASLEGLAKQKHVALTSQIEPAKGSIYGDRDRLMQVFINIISNAIKFNNSAEPRVTITTRSSDRYFCAEISDNGPGIAEEDHELIFSKFARRWESAEGSGLGLAITRHIVDRFGGSVDVRSAPGKGATFIVTLPYRAVVQPKQ